jgi:hypothetical protein
MFKKFDTNSPASFDLGLNGATPASSGVYVPGSLGGTSEAVSYFSPQNENLVIGSAIAGYGMSVAPSSTQGFTLARSSITTLSGSASVAGSVASLVVAGLAIQTSGAANSTAVDDAITAYTTPRDSTVALNTTHNTNFPLVSATLNPNSITSATTEWTNYRNGVTAVTTAITTYNGTKNSTNLTAITTAVNAVQGLWTAYYNIAIASLAVAATATKGSPLTFTKNGANGVTNYVPTLDVGNAKAGRIDLPGNITFSNGGVNFTYTGTLTRNAEGISIVKAAAADTGVATLQSDLNTLGLIVVSSQIRTNSVVMINENSGIFATPPTQFSIEPYNGYALIKSSVGATETVVSWAIMN